MRRFIVFVGLLILSSVQPAAAQTRAADERAVRAALQGMGTAINARDFAAFAAVFTDDADLIMVASPRVSGRPAVRALMQQRWSSSPAQQRITITVRSVRFLSPDVVVADCTAEFSVGEPARDRATFVLARRGGAWQVAAMRVMQAEG